MPTESECWSTSGDGSLHLCSVGPKQGYEKHLLAVGDSHNNTLLGVYESIAETMNWRIDVAGRIGCYWTDADLEFGTTALNAECQQWKDEVTAHVAASDDLDGVLVTNARRAPVVPRKGESVEDATVRGLTSAWKALPDGVPVLALVDNPVMPRRNRRVRRAERPRRGAGLRGAPRHRAAHARHGEGGGRVAECPPPRLQRPVLRTRGVPSRHRQRRGLPRHGPPDGAFAKTLAPFLTEKISARHRLGPPDDRGIRWPYAAAPRR